MFTQSNSFVVIKLFVVDLCCAFRFVIRLHKLFSYLLCCVLCFVTRFRLFLLCSRITIALCRSSCLCFHGLQWVVAVFCHSFALEFLFFNISHCAPLLDVLPLIHFSDFSVMLCHSMSFVVCRIWVFSSCSVVRWAWFVSCCCKNSIALAVEILVLFWFFHKKSLLRRFDWCCFFVFVTKTPLFKRENIGVFVLSQEFLCSGGQNICANMCFSKISPLFHRSRYL